MSAIYQEQVRLNTALTQQELTAVEFYWNCDSGLELLNARDEEFEWDAEFEPETLSECLADLLYLLDLNPELNEDCVTVEGYVYPQKGGVRFGDLVAGRKYWETNSINAELD